MANDSVYDFEKAAKGKVKASKYGIVNTMTIPQLRRAKEVLKKKKDGAEGATQQKMEEMIAEYEKAEKQIYKYYSSVAAHPQGKSLLAIGKLKTVDTLTIQSIKGLKAVNGKDMGKLDSKVGNKIALGAGVGMIAAGIMSTGTNDTALFTLLWNLIKNLSPHNKLGLALITAGIATIGGTHIAKKMAANKRKRNLEQAKINEAENEMYENATKGESSVDEVALAGAKFEGQSFDNMVNALVDHPELMNKYADIIRNNGFDQTTGKQYTAQERKNIKLAIDKAREVQKELDAQKAELDGRASKKDPEEGPYTGGEETTTGDTGNKKPKPKTTPAVETARKALAGMMTPANNTKEARDATVAQIGDFIAKLDTIEGLTPTEKEQLKKIAEARKAEIENIKDGRKQKLEDLSPEVKKQLGIEEPANG